MILDDDFAAELRKKRWHVDDYGYPRHSPSYQTGIRLHTVVYQHYNGPIPAGCVIDHIDRNLWNATPENLRAVPQCVNAANHGKLSGVHQDKRNGRWIAQVALRGKQKRRHLGCFSSREEAQCVARLAFFEQYPELRCG